MFLKGLHEEREGHVLYSESEESCRIAEEFESEYYEEHINLDFTEDQGIEQNVSSVTIHLD